MESDRIHAVAREIFEYVKSPSLRHIRDSHSIHKLAKEIVKTLDHASSVWAKWDGPREEIAKAVGPCWIPIEDLQAFLNRLPGQNLTTTDVVQRLRAISEEPYAEYPKEELKAGCLALYEAEKARGTEMPAIIGALREYVEAEEDRLHQEQEETYRRNREEERLRLERRFLSGADCGWMQINKSECFYCRRNGRTFRTTPDKEKRWQLYRIENLEDAGLLLGSYDGRRAASKALEKIAYQPEF